jgi:hypothetical protein
MQAPQVDIWHLLFEQTPVLLRGVLGFLTLGLFTLAGILYRWHLEDMRRIESRMDKIEDRMDEGFSEIRGHLIDMNLKK